MTMFGGRWSASSAVVEIQQAKVIQITRPEVMAEKTLRDPNTWQLDKNECPERVRLV